jgi:hypothetical protein
MVAQASLASHSASATEPETYGVGRFYQAGNPAAWSSDAYSGAQDRVPERSDLLAQKATKLIRTQVRGGPRPPG